MRDLRPLPMLANKYDPRKHDSLLGRNLYAVEEKYDGHRCIVRVNDSLGDAARVEAWSRTGKDCSQKLASHLRAELRNLPPGLYDCELLLPGGHSYDVTRLEVQHKLHLVVFDVLELNGESLCSEPWTERRFRLVNAVPMNSPFVYASKVHYDVQTPQALMALVESIWEVKGEGVIVKDKRAVYSPGKRRDAFLKIKDCGNAVVTIIGFEAGTTSDYNVAVFKDDAGVVSKVKLLNDDVRAQCLKLASGLTDHPGAPDHPWVGRRLCIEYHERTPDGSYRHARWDRWEDE